MGLATLGEIMRLERERAAEANAAILLGDIFAPPPGTWVEYWAKLGNAAGEGKVSDQVDRGWGHFKVDHRDGEYRWVNLYSWVVRLRTVPVGAPPLADWYRPQVES